MGLKSIVRTFGTSKYYDILPFKIKDNFKLFLINVFFFNLHVLQRRAKNVAFVICLQVLIQNALEFYNLCLSYHIFKVFYDQKSSPPTV